MTSFYLDLSLLDKYWSETPAYHHTASISLAYALREALRLVDEEGLPARFARHQRNAERLWQGLEDAGLVLAGAAGAVDSRAYPPLSWRPAWTMPACGGGCCRTSTSRSLEDSARWPGKVWRIGLMGYSSRPENVITLLGALAELLGTK